MYNTKPSLDLFAGPSDSGAVGDATRTSVLVVNFDDILEWILTTRPGASFDRKLFTEEHWKARPNSTQRLNLANFQALRAISGQIRLTYIFFESLPVEVSEYFDLFDVVVINQAPSPSKKMAVQRIVEGIQERPTSARLIFGTEMTWFREVRNRQLSLATVHSVYTNHTLLRHTAKTDGPAYLESSFFNHAIQEFELAIDCSVVKPATPVESRNAILYVKAPPGRQTKNNDSIDFIRERIAQSTALSSLDEIVMEPPYSTLQYWDVLSRARYLVFTSLGETFSYVLNDAKASGVVSLFPESMYESHVAHFAVDSYPDMPGRYTDTDSLLQILSDYESDLERLSAASRAERNYVLKNFSVERCASNWSSLLSGHDLNRESVLLVDLEARGWSVEDALDKCVELGCRYFVPFQNAGTSSVRITGYSEYYPSHDVSLIRDFIYVHKSTLRQLLGPNRRPAKGESGRAFRTYPRTEALSFWKMLSRVYKIGTVYYGAEVEDPLGSLLRSRLKIHGNIRDRYRSILLRSVS